MRIYKGTHEECIEYAKEMSSIETSIQQFYVNVSLWDGTGSKSKIMQILDTDRYLYVNTRYDSDHDGTTDLYYYYKTKHISGGSWNRLSDAEVKIDCPEFFEEETTSTRFQKLLLKNIYD